jgi:uncharacterized protein YndB with AHSA1/START domain
MSVTKVDKSVEDLSITLIADFDATVEQVWELWADPRKLERWWGPPTHPATFVTHDFSPGGEVTYYMTAPEGERYHGWWRVVEVAPPTTLEVEDGFADADGVPVPDMPVSRMRVELAPHGAGTRMTMRGAYETLEQMEQVVAMGVMEGLTAAVNQMDALLAA